MRHGADVRRDDNAAYGPGVEDLAEPRAREPGRFGPDVLKLVADALRALPRAHVVGEVVGAGGPAFLGLPPGEVDDALRTARAAAGAQLRHQFGDERIRRIAVLFGQLDNAG